MKKIRLKDPVIDIFGALYEVGLERFHQEEIESKKPPHTCSSTVPASESQKAHRQLFKQAVAYAKAALADPHVRIYYQTIAKQQGKRPWGLAFSDGMNGIDLLSKK